MFNKNKNQKVALGYLVEGLPIPQNCNLLVKLTPENLLLKHLDKNEFSIDLSKLNTIEIYNSTALEKIVSQSAPGMIIGAATFGLLGAMVGGRTKTKEKKLISYYLVVNYGSDEPKTVVIDVSIDCHNAAKLVDYFKTLKPTTAKRIEL